MAKAVGLLGNVIGKLGNAVGYRVKDSNNKQTQGFRVYQPIVSNPRSYGQAVQRARMKPINNFYRALKDIIDRGFEGKAYGNPSRLEFLRLAMSNFSGPWVPKGYNVVVPGTFTIANGSLPFDSSVYLYNMGRNLYGSIKVSSTFVLSTSTALSSELISQNPNLHDGDQVTFVWFDTNGDGYIAKSTSILIDTINEKELPEIIVVSSGANKFIGVEGTAIIAGACILSREGSNGAHLRSKAVMTVADSILDTYMTDAAMDAAVASYMSADGTTDWPEEAVEIPDYKSTVMRKVTAAMTDVAAGVGQTIIGYKTVSGDAGLFYILDGTDKVLVKPDGTKLSVTVEGTATNVTIKAGYTGLVMEYSSRYAFGA